MDAHDWLVRIHLPGGARWRRWKGYPVLPDCHYIVTDLTGTARELCSEEGDVHWRGDQQLWGLHRETRTPMALRPALPGSVV